MIKKKIVALLSVAAISVMGMFSLSGCGNGYEKQTFALDEDWELTITNDEVVFDDESGCDNLIVYVTAKNTSDSNIAYNSTANVNAFQDDNDRLSWCQIKNDDGSDMCTTSIGDEKIAPSDSVDIVYGWQLVNENPVKVDFGGYTVAVEGKEITFDVKDRITDEWKAAQKAAEDELAAKKDSKSFDIVGAKGDIADGWYIDEREDDKVKIVKEVEDGAAPYLKISESSNHKTAKECLESYDGIYPDSSVDSVEINGTKYERLNINDTQFLLFADTNEGSPVEIYGMFTSFDGAKDQLNKISIK